MFSFSLYELGCKSLDEVYKMSWREFTLRSFGFKRHEKETWLKVREISYSAIIGSHLDPKKIPKSKEKYLPLDADSFQKGVSETHKEVFINAYKKYMNERKTAI